MLLECASGCRRRSLAFGVSETVSGWQCRAGLAPSTVESSASLYTSPGVASGRGTRRKSGTFPQLGVFKTTTTSCSSNVPLRLQALRQLLGPQA